MVSTNDHVGVIDRSVLVARGVHDGGGDHVNSRHIAAIGRQDVLETADDSQLSLTAIQAKLGVLPPCAVSHAYRGTNAAAEVRRQGLAKRQRVLRHKPYELQAH